MPVHGPLGAACRVSHGPECTAAQAQSWSDPLLCFPQQGNPETAWPGDGSHSRVLHTELTLHFRGLPSVSI